MKVMAWVRALQQMLHFHAFGVVQSLYGHLVKTMLNTN